MTERAAQVGTTGDDGDRIPVVLAALPTCPGCGSKDRAHRVTKTYRPFGNDDDCKTQYTTCLNCETRFKIEWE